jgi:hypothetical protein
MRRISETSGVSQLLCSKLKLSLVGSSGSVMPCSLANKGPLTQEFWGFKFTSNLTRSSAAVKLHPVIHFSIDFIGGTVYRSSSSLPYYIHFLFFFSLFSALTSFFRRESTILYFPLTPFGLPEIPLFPPLATISLTCCLGFFLAALLISFEMF